MSDPLPPSLSAGGASAVDATSDNHLTPPLAGWHLWRQVQCRSAGFPAELALGFGDPSLGLSAAAALDAADEAHRAWSALRQRARASFRDLLVQQRGGRGDRPFAKEADEGVDHDPAHGVSRRTSLRMSQWRRALKDIDRRRDSAAVAACVGADERLAPAAATDRQVAALAAFHSAHADAAAASRRHAARLAADPRLREAITWQNRALLRTALDPLAQRTVIDDHRPNRAIRRMALIVAAYAQRYCLKNDTIGFFGPVGWARFEDVAESSRVVPGGRLLARRRVYFEDWAIRALADRLSTDALWRPWTVPRRAPHVRVDGRTVLLAGRPFEADTVEVAALAACDGIRTAREVAARLLTHPLLDFETEDEALRLLDLLATRGRIDQRFEVRVGDPHPEVFLRAQLERIDDPEAQAQALLALDALEQARAEVGAAAGDGERLHDALCRFDARFELICDVPAKRNAGKTYGARAPLYEDCVREMSISLGTPLLQALQAPLSLVLEASRWFCHRLARIVEAHWAARFDSLSPHGGEVDLAAFWLHVQDTLFGEPLPELEALAAELGERWAKVLGLEDGRVRRLERSVALLRPSVASAFHAEDSGWASGMHHSPDVMVCGAAGSQDGGPSFVLGEVHAGINTLMNQTAHQQHSFAQELMTALQGDLQTGRVIPLLSREGARQPIRVQVVADPRVDVELCLSPDARPLAPERALAASDLVVERQDGRLVARQRVGGPATLLCDLFGEFLSGLAAPRFRLLPPRPYLPRITIDRLVVQRESWRFTCSSLSFVSGEDEAGTFLAATHWRRQHGLPRLVFVKAPWETKPFCVDLDSPLHVVSLERQIRNALGRGLAPDIEIMVSEMLPAPDELWLADGEGHQYTSELRIVACHESDRRSRTTLPPCSPIPN